MNINKTIHQLNDVKDKFNTIPQWKSKDRYDMLYLIGEVEKAFPKNNCGIKFNIIDDSDVSLNTIQISGLFHAKDKYSWIPERPRRAPDIFITVHYNPKNNYNIKFTKKNYNQFLFRLYATIAHEMIQRSQWSRIR